jgi:hypothetical protein
LAGAIAYTTGLQALDGLPFSCDLDDALQPDSIDRVILATILKHLEHFNGTTRIMMRCWRLSAGMVQGPKFSATLQGLHCLSMCQESFNASENLHFQSIWAAATARCGWSHVKGPVMLALTSRLLLAAEPVPRRWMTYT